MNNHPFRDHHFPNLQHPLTISDLARVPVMPTQPQMYPNFNHYISTMMFNESAMQRRHTARESTGPLKGWLQEHPRNPYPTKAEKVMLALISGMTLTQVSTWFANARRRLKKESTNDDDTKTDGSSGEVTEDNEQSAVAVYSSPSVIEERKTPSVEDRPEAQKESSSSSKIWRIVDELEKPPA